MSGRIERDRNRRPNPGWFKKGHDARRPTLNPGWFRKGVDPRRHQLTHAERVRGGQTTFRKFHVIGRWRPDWWERCRKRKKEDYASEENLYPDEQPGPDEPELPF